MIRRSSRKSIFSILVRLAVAPSGGVSEDTDHDPRYIDATESDVARVGCPNIARDLAIDSSELNSNYPQRMVIGRRC